MKPRIALLLLLVPFLAYAQAPTTIQDQWRQTLKFGIDSQILDAITGIAEARDSSFTSELSALLQKSTNAAVQQAVLDFFAG